VTSHYLRCDHFGFTTSDLPSGSTVLGIEAGVTAGLGAAGNPLAVGLHWLLVVGGAIGGNDHASNLVGQVPPAVAVAGAGNDLWGLVINAGNCRQTDFGFVMAFQTGPTPGNTYTIHTQGAYMRVKVQY
jgi:hypothetical protein